MISSEASNSAPSSRDASVSTGVPIVELMEVLGPLAAAASTAILLWSLVALLLLLRSAEEMFGIPLASLNARFLAHLPGLAVTAAEFCIVV